MVAGIVRLLAMGTIIKANIGIILLAETEKDRVKRDAS